MCNQERTLAITKSLRTTGSNQITNTHHCLSSNQKSFAKLTNNLIIIIKSKILWNTHEQCNQIINHLKDSKTISTHQILCKTYECRQQDEVDRRLLPLDVEGDEQDHAEDEGDHDQPGVLVNQTLDRGVEEADAGDQGSHQKLDWQQAVHLAEESHPVKKIFELSISLTNCN